MTLAGAASSMGIELDESQLSALTAHLDLLDQWNERMNLTAIRDRPSQITKHVLDSLSVRPYLRGDRVADVGSGAGFPGIPLAIVERGRRFTLIDSTAKKCRFLEHVREALDLANVEVANSRAEAFKPEQRFDTVLARAVGPLADLVRYAGSLVAGEGRLLAMKGRFPEDEIAARLNGWKVLAVHSLAVPGLDEQRHLVELVRSHHRAA